MARYLAICVSVVVALSGIVQADSQTRPMVAFVCDRPAMHLTEQGWIKDDTTDCLKQPVDILEYCKKVYSGLEVTGVLQANKKRTIVNWCGFGHVTCDNQFTVKPYRCVVKDAVDTVSETGDDTSSQPKPVSYMTEQLNGKHWNEHEYYVKAKSDMQKHHEAKVAKLMNDWQAARKQVQDLKVTDPKAADKLNDDVSARFEKLYEAMEVESVQERKQLASLHLHRVQTEIANMKRRAMEDYYLAILENQTDSTKVLKTLRHYVRALIKDRQHTVNHFRHLQDTDPAEAESILAQTAEHLTTVDQQWKQAFDTLDQQSTYKDRIRELLVDYLDSYNTLDSSASVIILSHKQATEDDTSDAKLDDEKKETKEQSTDEKVTSSTVRVVAAEDKKDIKPKKITSDDVDVAEDYDDVSDDASDESKQSTSTTTSAPKTTSTKKLPQVDRVYDDAAERFDEFDDEDSYDSFAAEVEPQAGHMQNSVMEQTHVRHSSGSRAESRTNLHTAVPVGIAVGSFTVLAVIVVGVAIMWRQGRRRMDGYAPPGQAGDLTPEERHVSSMQANGYENPTYKYFELTAMAEP